ncbi:MAG: hypothetical protein QGH42_11730 [Kiritimatiellia bacterium]|nr:hypothetical protein [Kiritimatiellia bacterium]
MSSEANRTSTNDCAGVTVRAEAGAFSRIAPFLLLFIFALFCWHGLNNCSFTLIGDASTYLIDSCKLRDGYLATNLGVLSGHTEDHVQLVTEGGYPAFLWLAGKLHKAFPFLSNGVLAALMITLLALLVREQAHSARHAAFSMLLLVILVFSNQEVWALVCQTMYPLRSTLAHVLALAGVVTGVSAAKGSARYRARLLLAGILVGLSTWTRVPHVLFIGPIFLYQAQLSRFKPSKYTVQCGLLLAVGLLVGLLPLFGQNLLEGKVFYDCGQMSELVMQKRSFGNEPGSFPRRGIHPGNILYVLPDVLRGFRGAFSGWTWWLALLSLGVGLKLRLRLTMAYAAIVAVYILFYAHYNRFFGRFLLPSILFTLALAAYLPGLLADAAVRRFRSARSERVAAMGLVGVLLALVLWLSPNSEDDVKQTACWRDALRFEQWLREHFEEESVFVVNRQPLESWMAYFGTGKHERLGWTGSFLSDAASLQVDNFLRQGKRVFLPELATLDGRDYASWWREDIQHRYDLMRRPISLDCAAWGHRVVVSEVVPQSARCRQLSLPPSGREVCHLYLLARELPSEMTVQEVTLEHPQWGFPVRRNLRTGVNILPVPTTVTTKGTSITVTSSEVLPSFVLCQWMKNTPIYYSLRSMETMPLSMRMLSGADVEWGGYAAWARDWDGSPFRSFKSYPVYLLKESSALRLPALSEALALRIHLLAKSRGSFSMRSLSDVVTYAVNGNELAASSWMSQGDGQAMSMGEKGWHSALFVQKVVVPSALLMHQDDAFLQMSVDRSSDLSVQIAGVDVAICEGGEDRNMGVPVLQGGRRATVWPISGSRVDTLMGRSSDPSFRMLDRGALVDFDQVPGQDGEGLLVDVLVPVINADASGSVSFGNADSPVYTWTSDFQEPHTRILLQMSEELHVTPSYSSPLVEPLILHNARQVDIPAWDEGLDMNPRHDFYFMFRDFWPSVEQADGRHVAWTKMSSSIHYPVLDLTQSIEMSMMVKGRPAVAGQQNLVVSLNGHRVDEFALPPWEEGISNVVVTLPSKMLCEGVNNITLCSEPWSPSDITGSPDTRKLGFLLERVRWRSYAMMAASVMPSRCSGDNQERCMR